MKKTVVAAKIAGRQDGIENPVATERDISTDWLNDFFSTIVDEDSSGTRTISSSAAAGIQYTLHFKRVGNTIFVHGTIKNNTLVPMNFGTKVINLTVDLYQPKTGTVQYMPSLNTTGTYKNYIYFTSNGIWLGIELLNNHTLLINGFYNANDL